MRNREREGEKKQRERVEARETERQRAGDRTRDGGAQNEKMIRFT